MQQKGLKHLKNAARLCQLLEESEWGQSGQKTQSQQWWLQNSISRWNINFCGHQHVKSCSNCEGLRKAIDSIENAVKSSKVQYESEDQKDEIQYTLSQGCRAIEEWKKHILRTVNQDGAHTEILRNLSEDEVFIERDWAMKFLPMVYSYRHQE